MNKEKERIIKEREYAKKRRKPKNEDDIKTFIEKPNIIYVLEFLQIFEDENYYSVEILDALNKFKVNINYKDFENVSDRKNEIIRKINNQDNNFKSDYS